MGADQHFDWLGTAASALDWWQEAGGDCIVDDVPRDWFAAAEPARGAPVSAGPPVVPDTELADDIAAFLAWRTSPDAPEATWHGPALPATGPMDARIMVLVDCPDPDDAQGGQLLGGATGRLFDRMLAAIGLTRADIHLAAVATKRPIAGRMPHEIEARLGSIARHHAALAAPARLLCLGNAASRAILGTEMPANRGHLHGFNHKAGHIGVVASFHPRLLIQRPALKAEAWKDLQMLMGDMI